MLGRAGRAMESWVAIRALIAALDKDFLEELGSQVTLAYW